MKKPILHHAKHVVRNYFLHIICGSLVLMAGMLLVNSSMKAAGSILFLDSFGYADGLITNEYAHWNPTSGSSKTNANWDMTSGSLFAQSGSGWSGSPDDANPNAASSSGNDSAIFRLNTKRYDFGDVKVSFKLKLNSLSTSPSTPAVAWDGIHIFLRYQSEYNLYYASVNRRDGAVVIKKKCSGGSSNGGTYYPLNPGEVGGHSIPYGTWQTVAASVANNTDGSVTIKLYREGQLLVTATDTGVGCGPIRSAGATGIRGDNADFLFDDFTVESLAASATPLPTATPTPKSHGGGKPTPTPTTTADTTAVQSSGSVDGTSDPEQQTGDTPHPTPAGANPVTGEVTDKKVGKPAPFSPAVLTKAAHTDPTFLAGLLAALLSAILGALIYRDHHSVRPKSKPVSKAPVRSRRR